MNQYITKIVGYLKTSVEEEPGVLSSTRIMFILSILTTLVVWAIICLHNRAVVTDIPNGVVAFNAALAVTKMGSKFAEK